MILYRQDRYIHFPVEIWLHFLDRIGPNPLQMNSYWLQTTKCHILGLEDLNDWYISFHLDQPDNCSTDLRTTIFRRQNHTDHCHNSADYYFLIELSLAILKIVKTYFLAHLQHLPTYLYKKVRLYQLGTYLELYNVQVNCGLVWQTR